MSYYYPGASVTYSEGERYLTGTVKRVDDEKLLLEMEGGKTIRYGQVAYHNGPAPDPMRFREGFR